ncbi:UNVERIFIED_CONTAM: hypothetical protein FKN15_029773 [Acipenser sinensis]
MDVTALSVLLEALDQRQVAAERKREARCHPTGHIARLCSPAIKCNMVACYLASEAGKRLGNGREEPCIIDVVVGEVSTHALVDSSGGGGNATQCDREGEVTGLSKADVTVAPLNMPDMWDQSVDLVWDQHNDPTLV